MALYNLEYEATKASAPIGPDGTPGAIVSSTGTPSGRRGAESERLKANLEGAERLERRMPLCAELNTKLSDIGKAIPEIGKVTSKLPDFLKEVPVVDVMATGVVVGFQVIDGMEKGWSAQHAVATDVTAGAVGLGAGARR